MTFELVVEGAGGPRVLMMGKREDLLDVAAEGAREEAKKLELDLQPTDDGFVLLRVEAEGLRVIRRWRVRQQTAFRRPSGR